MFSWKWVSTCESPLRTFCMCGIIKPAQFKPRLPMQRIAAAFSSMTCESMSSLEGRFSSSSSLSREKPSALHPFNYSSVNTSLSLSDSNAESRTVTKMGAMSDFTTLQMSEKYSIAVSLSCTFESSCLRHSSANWVNSWRASLGNFSVPATEARTPQQISDWPLMVYSSSDWVFIILNRASKISFM